MSVGDDLKDSATRHTVYTLRYARSTYRKHSRLIDQAVADMASRLAIRAPSAGSITRARLEAMLINMRETSAALYKALESAVDGDLRELAAYESKFTLDMINDSYPIELSLTTVTPAAIHAAAMAKPFQGRILRQWWRDQDHNVQRAFQSAVRLGYVQGESIPQITRRVAGVGDMVKRQVDAVIRTAVRHTAQTAMHEVSKANSDIIAAEEWTATLDGRTSAICRGLDGKQFPIDKGPQVPAHFNCRSARVPVPATWATLYGDADDNSKLNRRRYVADKRRVKDIPRSERDQIIGSTEAKTYNEWLKTQKRPFVEDVLGKKKAKLYLDGDLSLDRFTDREGHEYTLLELEKRERKSFKKAQID